MSTLITTYFENMKVLGLLFFVGVTLASQANIYSIELASEYFELFMKTYNKHYATEAEEAKRFEIFKQNLELINQKNYEAPSDALGISKFSDLTSEEFISMYTGLRGDNQRASSECQVGTVNSTKAPEGWDWNQLGIVSRPKDQGMCGSCWAFSTIGCVEAHYAKKHDTLLDLSEQQLVDCDPNSYGCGGATDMKYPFLYLVNSTGAMLEKHYRYLENDCKCRFDKYEVAVNVTGCVAYHEKDEENLKNIIYNVGPLSIGVDAIDMQSYTGKVLEKCDWRFTNHAVLLVGYGTEYGVPYWLIKNSWGQDFGENGYIKIKRGINACGLMETPMIYAEVD